MTITCKTEDQFFDAINQLVQKGLTFKSNMDTLVITLTGGY